MSPDIKRTSAQVSRSHLTGAAVAGVTDNVAPRPDAVDRLGNNASQ